MELSTLKSHIKTGKFDPYYIFTGEDSGVQRTYLQQIARVKNCEIKILDSITDLRPKKHLNTSFQNSSVCVLFDCKEFIQDDKAEAFTTQICASESVLAVFIYTSIDKRTKFYKAHQDRIVEFQHLKPEVLTKYVQKFVQLSERGCQKLIEACECDYGRILLEIDKLTTYMQVAGVSADEGLRQLFDSGVIYRPPYDAVFDFVDAALKNQRRLAFELLAESYGSGEATLVLLANLYSSAKALLQVQSYGGSGKITEVTGLTAFQVKLASGRKGYNSDRRLIQLMRLVRDAEKGIKIGDIEDSVAVAYVLSKFWL